MIRPLTEGIYQYDFADSVSKSRVHLRVDPDLSGLLVANASRIVHLNPSALYMAFLTLEKVPEKEALRALKDRFSAPMRQLKQGYLETRARVEALIDESSGLCPICDLGLEMDLPFTRELSAPYRMDLALTYRCNNDCAHCYNARSRSYPELPTESWKSIIDKVWSLKIPHVVFTGGEPTLRSDLPELVAYAEQTGLVAGLNTNGRKLSDPVFTASLVEAGLDHVQITLESNRPEIHDQMVHSQGAWEQTVQGIRNAVNSKLYMMTNTTLLENNEAYLLELLSFLRDLGVPTIGLNALIYSGRGSTVNTGLNEKDLPGLLKIAAEFTQESGQRLIWYTPTQYCHFDPLQLDLGIKGCTAAYYNMCIEPDGQVIPCQSYYEALGDFLSSPWNAIWEHPLALSLRHRKDVPPACITCDFFAECGGGCPLARDRQNPKPIYRDLILRRS
ncbi:MAG: radical SAM protein [Anaerolineaceae bacterium]|nr:radical SAM protein [Anaerolineaceae bacterium]